MSYPNLQLQSRQLNVYELSKTGSLQNAYSPLQNLMTDKELGDFTTPQLKLSSDTPVKITVTDEYDGSQNLILNDDVNAPRLINSRLSIEENKTYRIPEHSGNSATNVYDNNTLDKDINLLKLYDSIPKLLFNGISSGGEFKCGSYVFYFKLSDSDGNLTNIIQESGIVQVHMGETNQAKVRMGLEDEVSDKQIQFTLSGLDSGFDYVRVFYERATSGQDGVVVKSYYMINQNFPIIGNEANLTFTGAENIIQVDKSDIQNEFADISAAKTQTVLHNILFMGNTQGQVYDHSALQQLAWRIIPKEVLQTDLIGGINSDYKLISTQGSDTGAYYNVKNTYLYTGYWPDEYYRFGVVFIFNNNQLSQVFNIQGVDFSLLNDKLPDKTDDTYNKVYKQLFIPLTTSESNQSEDDPYQSEPHDYLFRKDIMTNSKGVVKFSSHTIIDGIKDSFTPNVLGIEFDLTHIGSNNASWKEELAKHNIKGLFFVRQKRIPSILAQGLVVGLTGKDHGSIPVLKNKDNAWCTYSFLNGHRLLDVHGHEIEISSKIEPKALLVPDFEVNPSVYNALFTGAEYTLSKVGSIGCKVKDRYVFPENYNEAGTQKHRSLVTSVPQNTFSSTDGENYFSTIVGSAFEPFKTADVNKVWNQTVPQDLTTSTSLIRGQWGSFVGISCNKFQYGDIVNITIEDSEDNPNYNLIQFQKRFADYSFYSAISPRYNYDEDSSFTCYRGDCFPSLFTHRMMSNFIDPELPTNTKIIDPGTWAKNYAVRCTASIMDSTTMNIADENDGWYIEAPPSKQSVGCSIAAAILSGNLVGMIDACKQYRDLEKGEWKTSAPKQSKFCNEIATVFEIRTKLPHNDDSESTPVTFEALSSVGDMKKAVVEGWIRKVNPSEMESSGLNLKALFKPSADFELHGANHINRADVNAVGLGQWITFPICSSYNLALRDVDFRNATEEASFNKKRSFYPLEERDVHNPLLEAQTINGAAKRSIASCQQAGYSTVPYLKQEFFNRIYWSKPNVSSEFINSYRMIFKNQYKEYNKEFGTITKIDTFKNNLVVIFEHGIGLLSVSRDPKTELESIPYLASRNVIPDQVSIISDSFGSMWHDSVIKVTDIESIFGVDTVAKKIWQLSGDGFKCISDHTVTKFLNDFIDLSEYDQKEYQGHINVKTHYNAFKRDVIFTYYKDLPIRDESGLIVSWKPGTTWSLCYNIETSSFTTFYDWYPLESCNIDNIFFSFDKEQLHSIESSSNADILIERIPEFEQIEEYSKVSKSSIDTQFSEKQKLISTDTILTFTPKIKSGYQTPYVCVYVNKDRTNRPKGGQIATNESVPTLQNKYFYYIQSADTIQFPKGEYYDPKVVYLKEGISNNISDKHPLYLYNLRNSEPNKMLLWKHGQSGLYDIQSAIKPTNWYGKQHEFNFEFVVKDSSALQKIFNNLKIISNKTAPDKFEYEIVGEGYEWFEYKPIVEWINKKAQEDTTMSLQDWFKYVLGKNSNMISSVYADFPSLHDELKIIYKLPYLTLKLTDKKGSPERPAYKWNGGHTYWDSLSSNQLEDKFSYNCSEPCLISDPQLSEVRIRTEQLGNDIKKFGRLRGNMQYLEDFWNVEIRPIYMDWCYLDGNGALQVKKISEARHRDKYLKVKVRYSGENLALIQAIITMFNESYA